MQFRMRPSGPKKSLTFSSGALTFSEKQPLLADMAPPAVEQLTVLYIYAKRCINMQFGTYRKLFYMFHRPFSVLAPRCRQVQEEVQGAVQAGAR